MKRLQDAIRLRDQVLKLMQGNSEPLDLEQGAKTLTWERDGFRATLKTPFNPLPDSEPPAATYDHGLLRQLAGKKQPYQLNVWRGPKVLSIEWGDWTRIISFKRGEWEARLLALGEEAPHEISSKNDEIIHDEGLLGQIDNYVKKSGPDSN